MSLSERICELINRGEYVVGVHAVERLDERGILEWQVVEGTRLATIVHERLDNLPDPIAEFEIWLPDGTPAKAVWALLEKSGVAKLVTVHFLAR